MQTTQTENFDINSLIYLQTPSHAYFCLYNSIYNIVLDFLASLTTIKPLSHVPSPNQDAAKTVATRHNKRYSATPESAVTS